MNPYNILGVGQDATDRQVRDAYLAAIRQFPPDTAPDRFRLVSQAYEKIKTRDDRLRFLLFDKSPPGDSPVDTVLNHLRLAPPPRPLPKDAMLELIRGHLTTISRP